MIANAVITLCSYLGEGDYESKFIRTCPVGIKSCFGAKGFYDRDDSNLKNDISKYRPSKYVGKD